MKGIFKILSMVILSAALIGAGVLVKKNQETRRGATAAETSAQVLPDKVATKAGQTFTVDVWLNTGKSTDKLTGAEFTMAFDPAKVVFVSSAAQNGYTILAEDSEGEAGRWFKMVAMGDEKAGAVNVVKLTFRSVSNGTSTIIVGKGASIMVSGQSSTWDVAKSNGSQVEAAAGSVTVVPPIKCSWCGLNCGIAKADQVCPMIASPAGKSCTNVGGKCTVTTTTGDKPCSSDANCASNEYCYQPPLPSCPPGAMCKQMVPARVCKLKKTAGEGQACGGVAGIMCATGLRCEYGLTPEKVPGTTDTSPKTNPDQGGICVKDTGRLTPTPQGNCGQRCTQNQQCQGGMTCAPIWWPCGPMPLAAMGKVQADQGLSQTEVSEMIRICPTVKGVMPSGYESMTLVKMPSFYGVCRNPKCLSSANCSCTPTPTPTVISGNQVNMVGMFVDQTVKVGGEVLGVVRVDSGNLKVSAVNVQYTYDPVYFDFVESVPPEGATVLKNTVDRATGRVTVYLSWSLPADKLPTSPNVSQFKLKTKKVGTGSMGFYRSYVPEVSGLDGNGKSTGFAVGFSTDPKYQSVVITNVISCSVCTSGLAKSTGNANCDGTVSSIDFEIWRSEMFDQGGLAGTVKSTWKSDYNCDQKVSGVDFEIWRKTVFQ